MEFKVGQRVKFKNEEEYKAILKIAHGNFDKSVGFDDTFSVVNDDNKGFVFIKTKDGYNFWCRTGRLVPIIHILEGSEEL